MTDEEAVELAEGVRQLLAPPLADPAGWEEEKLVNVATAALLRAELGDTIGAAAILVELSRADPARGPSWLRLRDRVEHLPGVIAEQASRDQLAEPPR